MLQIAAEWIRFGTGFVCRWCGMSVDISSKYWPFRCPCSGEPLDVVALGKPDSFAGSAADSDCEQEGD